jgi:drug/metabolite transporter (DMT)-like permease
MSDSTERGPGEESARGEETVPTADEETEPAPPERGKWMSLVIGTLGAWLLVSPWLFGLEFGDAMGLNSVLTGALLAILGGYNFSRRAAERLASAALAGVAALLGLWLLVTPWIFELTLADAVAWNVIVVGLLVAALGLYSSYEAREQRLRASVTR